MSHRTILAALGLTLVVVAGCSATADPPHADTLPTGSSPIVVPSSQPATTSPPIGDSDELPAVVVLPFGNNGIDVIPGDVDREAVGPSELTALRGSVSIVDPIGRQILRYRGSIWTQVADLAALDLANVAFLATTETSYVAVELDLAQALQRIHLIDRNTGTLTASADIPAGLRLEDGLSGVVVDSDGIKLEFEGGIRYSGWQVDESTFSPSEALTYGDRSIRTVPPDLEIDGVVVSAGLDGALGGLQYLGMRPDGGHVLLRQEVITLDPVIEVASTIEWYGSALEYLGSVLLPGIEDQYIPVVPDVSVDADGLVWVLTTSSDKVEIRRVEPIDNRP